MHTHMDVHINALIHAPAGLTWKNDRLTVPIKASWRDCAPFLVLTSDMSLQTDRVEASFRILVAWLPAVHLSIGHHV